jgi:hypothetical protein
VHPIEIRSGHDEPLLLEPVSGTEVVECAGPEGMSGDAARALVRDAVAAPADGPPLEAHVVPGDRAVVAVAGVVPQAEAVLAAITERKASQPSARRWSGRSGGRPQSCPCRLKSSGGQPALIDKAYA